MVMNKCFVKSTDSVSGPIFSDDSVARELELIEKSTKKYEWISPTGELFSLELPHTVYPPREDTDLMAKNLIRMGPGRGRKCLEIGVGSGVLSLLCHRQGWKVSACDINPYAVAAARDFFSINSASEIALYEGGPGPSEDGCLEQWTDGASYDLIFWNMPYIKPTRDDTEHLGPLEDAALIDTTEQSLISITLAKISSSQILNNLGIGIFTIGHNYTEEEIHNICAKYGFASRITDELSFLDGESLRILTIWHPFAKTPHTKRKVVESTNNELLNGEWPIGSSLSAERQTKGRGRYNREWANSPELFACSWKINPEQGITPQLLQVLVGNVVKQSFESVQNRSQDCKIILKWPNDLILVEQGNWGKVCGILVESISKGSANHTVIGIGINISNRTAANDSDFPMGFADWYSKELNQEYLFTQINCRIAGLFESLNNIPKSNFTMAKQQAIDAINKGFMSCSSIIYRNKTVSLQKVNTDLTVSLITDEGEQFTCDETEDLIWLFA